MYNDDKLNLQLKVEGFFLSKLNLLLWEGIGLMDLEVLHLFIEQVASFPSLQLSSYY